MSQVPAYALVGLLVAAVLLLLVSGWLTRGLRAAGGVAGGVTVAGLVGLAAACATFVVFGNRHYGGTSSEGSHGRVANCDQWYQEVGLPAGRAALPGDLSAHCRQAAVDATWPSVGWSLLVGGVVVVLAFGAQLVSRRRAARRQAAVASRPAVRYVDSDS